MCPRQASLARSPLHVSCRLPAPLWLIRGPPCSTKWLHKADYAGRPSSTQASNVCAPSSAVGCLPKITLRPLGGSSVGRQKRSRSTGGALGRRCRRPFATRCLAHASIDIRTGRLGRPRRRVDRRCRWASRGPRGLPCRSCLVLAGPLLDLLLYLVLRYANFDRRRWAAVRCYYPNLASKVGRNGGLRPQEFRYHGASRPRSASAADPAEVAGEGLPCVARLHCVVFCPGCSAWLSQQACAVSQLVLVQPCRRFLPNRGGPARWGCGSVSGGGGRSAGPLCG